MTIHFCLILLLPRISHLTKRFCTTSFCQGDEAAVPPGLGDARAAFTHLGVFACTGLTAVANMDGRPLGGAH
ncbi:hypothetical protein HDV57DRAFT_478898 [Trichoderma longibrachiatum]